MRQTHKNNSLSCGESNIKPDNLLTSNTAMACSFNYTVNITNSSSVTEQMYSNSTSLILTDLTRGENYSFAVAITDSTGQHGQWSEELLRVTQDGNKPSAFGYGLPVLANSITLFIKIVLNYIVLNYDV